MPLSNSNAVLFLPVSPVTQSNLALLEFSLSFFDSVYVLPLYDARDREEEKEFASLSLRSLKKNYPKITFGELVVYDVEKRILSKEVIEKIPESYTQYFDGKLHPIEGEILPLLWNYEKTRNGSKLDLSREDMDEIADHKLYFCSLLAKMEKEHRYLHSVSVAKTAYDIALANGLDGRRAYLGGLLHDCAKDYPDEELLALIHEEMSEYEPIPSFALHQFAGKIFAKKKFGCEDEEILNAICFHCTGKKEMSDYEKIIYAADKVEPTRPFETKIGREACLKDLESGFVTTLKQQIRYFKERNISYSEYRLSKEMYQYYLGE